MRGEIEDIIGGQKILLAIDILSFERITEEN